MVEHPGKAFCKLFRSVWYQKKIFTSNVIRERGTEETIPVFIQISFQFGGFSKKRSKV